MSDAAAGAAHIVRVDPAYAGLIEAVGAFNPRPGDADAFNSLARAIVFQQLAGAAARAIHGRFTALLGGHPTAEGVLGTSIEQLRAVGLSGNKAASIADLALKATDGTLPLDRLDQLTDAEITQRLITVRGIGRWTAEMFLIFQLRRPDVWPVDDLGVRKGYAAIHHLPTPPAPKALDALGEIYRPYRTMAAWYCWRAVDTVLPETDLNLL
ncbi:MAG TPA: DNA-3-methyladenine glycosylase 2 family protein [Chloroflexota bacterium]|nr:DNA-3-methyladenine glycosylase 2 family protein [Chloroflexota bacterium]